MWGSAKFQPKCRPNGSHRERGLDVRGGPPRPGTITAGAPTIVAPWIDQVQPVENARFGDQRPARAGPALDVSEQHTAAPPRKPPTEPNPPKIAISRMAAVNSPIPTSASVRSLATGSQTPPRVTGRCSTRRTTSGRSRRASRTAASPCDASPITMRSGYAPRMVTKPVRIGAWSSQTSTSVGSFTARPVPAGGTGRSRHRCCYRSTVRRRRHRLARSGRDRPGRRRLGDDVDVGALTRVPRPDRGRPPLWRASSRSSVLPEPPGGRGVSTQLPVAAGCTARATRPAARLRSIRSGSDRPQALSRRRRRPARRAAAAAHPERARQSC